jgi:hypothetical protein
MRLHTLHLTGGYLRRLQNTLSTLASFLLTEMATDPRVIRKFHYFPYPQLEITRTVDRVLEVNPLIVIRR